jgi:hypothetical protein
MLHTERTLRFYGLILYTQGGAVLVFDGQATFENCVFDGNTAVSMIANQIRVLKLHIHIAH